MNNNNKIVPILLIIAMLSCKSNDTAISADGADHNALVKKYFDNFNKHNWFALASMYKEGALFKDPSIGMGVTRQSKADIIKKYTDLAGMYPNVRDSVIAVYPSGDKNVVVEFISTGSNTDGSFQLPICTIFTVENGLITKDYTYYDNFGD